MHIRLRRPGRPRLWPRLRRWVPVRPWVRRALTVVVVAALAFGHLTFLAAVPIAGGPREAIPRVPAADRWSPPRPHTDARFNTFATTGPRGEPGLWVPPAAQIPIRFVVEREVVDRFGLEELRAAIEVWNGTPGSRFGATITGVVDTGTDHRLRDGVNRIFMDRRSCGGRYLARAHMWPGELAVRDGHAARYVAEFDLGLCDRLQPEQLDKVFRHELLHMAGLDHLCNEGEPCHHADMEPDNTCRLMSPRAHPCQEPTDGDRDALVYLHPRLPRAGGADGRSTSAAVALATHPVPRSALSVVLTPEDAPLSLRAHGATLAGHLGVPHVLVDDDCSTGTDGRTIDRVLALAGRAVLVGEVSDGCEATLSGAWAVETIRLADTAAVVDHTLSEVLGDEPDRVVVAPAAADQGRTPIAAVAGPAAITLGAPLVVLEDNDDPGPVLDVLEEVESVPDVLVVADSELIDPRTMAAIAGAGVDVRRLPVRDAGEAATALAGIAEVAPATGMVVALVAAERPDHAIPAIGIAAASGGLLLPIDGEVREQHIRLLRERVGRGAIVGGPQGINDARQIELSRLVDGA